MSRPDPIYIDQLTAGAERWLRRCNNKPGEGIPIGRESLRQQLAISADVKVDGRGWITWPGTAGTFSAEPVPNEPPELPA